jgi:hypothetical protein
MSCWRGRRLESGERAVAARGLTCRPGLVVRGGFGFC